MPTTAEQQNHLLRRALSRIALLDLPKDAQGHVTFHSHRSFFEAVTIAQKALGMKTALTERERKGRRSMKCEVCRLPLICLEDSATQKRNYSCPSCGWSLYE